MTSTNQDSVKPPPQGEGPNLRRLSAVIGVLLIISTALFPLTEWIWQPRRAYAHFPYVDVVVEYPAWTAVKDEQHIEVMLINKSDRKLPRVKVFLFCTGIHERHLGTGSSGSNVIEFTNLEVREKQTKSAQIVIKELSQLSKIKLCIEAAIYAKEGQSPRRTPPIQQMPKDVYIQCVPIAYLGKYTRNVLSFLTSLPGIVSTSTLTGVVGLILDNVLSPEAEQKERVKKEQKEPETEEAEGQTEG
jgi:hypothetical protein